MEKYHNIKYKGKLFYRLIQQAMLTEPKTLSINQKKMEPQYIVYTSVKWIPQYYYITILLYYYITILLYYYITILLYYYITILLYILVLQLSFSPHQGVHFPYSQLLMSLFSPSPPGALSAPKAERS